MNPLRQIREAVAMKLIPPPSDRQIREFLPKDDLARLDAAQARRERRAAKRAK